MDGVTSCLHLHLIFLVDRCIRLGPDRYSWQVIAPPTQGRMVADAPATKESLELNWLIAELLSGCSEEQYPHWLFYQRNPDLHAAHPGLGFEIRCVAFKAWGIVDLQTAVGNPLGPNDVHRFWDRGDVASVNEYGVSYLSSRGWSRSST